MPTTKERDASWDNIKAALMLLTVFTHVISERVSGFVAGMEVFVYLFHMPMFVFISGYFGKKSSPKSIARMIYAFIIFNSLSLFVFGGWSTFFRPKWPNWYLLALTMWRLTAKYIADRKYSVPVLFAVAIAVGFILPVDNTLAIARTVAFYPFYAMGYRYTGEKRPGKKTGAICLCLTAAAAVTAFKLTENDVWGGSKWSSILTGDAYRDMECFITRIVWFIIAVIIIIGALAFAKNKEIPLFTAIGRNSLSVYLIHRFLIYPFRTMPAEIIPNPIHITIAIPFSVIVCILLSSDLVVKPLNKILGAGAAFLIGEEQPKLWNIVSAAIILVISIAILCGYIKVYSII